MSCHPFRLTVLALFAVLITAVPALAETPAWRVGMTPAFLHDQHVVLDDWRAYLERRLGRKIEFVQRDSYLETMDLIRLGKLDFAWICDYPYVHLGNHVRLLAVPVNQGKPLYRSYLIVSARDPHTQSLVQLRGKVFAYSDPYSNTGYLVPRYQLHQVGEEPERFFSRTFFTWSHRKAIEAVASGVAQGAAVDSFVWDTLAKIKPELTARTRIVSRSPEYGFPPFVAHHSVPEGDFKAMQGALLRMEQDPEGILLLQRLNLDGFTPGDPAVYNVITEMMNALGER
ncbi:MAG: ABC transporter substrate-binding protein [Gammaproteobacteria bacterium RIFOXYA12_FULL_61_12]|nr:MAG: ABC transporter substrate-binding protein [Gammaproteobacteria bacterium RIFOXYD12_FULL_61_37]OGT93886.1 MAG: ABC transporter substrate-binding protein [Gammaproteobacteria bacterium RIFOXYA12_FULL_61_12]